MHLERSCSAQWDLFITRVSLNNHNYYKLLFKGFWVTNEKSTFFDIEMVTGTLFLKCTQDQIIIVAIVDKVITDQCNNVKL